MAHNKDGQSTNGRDSRHFFLNLIFESFQYSLKILFQSLISDTTVKLRKHIVIIPPHVNYSACTYSMVAVWYKISSNKDTSFFTF